MASWMPNLPRQLPQLPQQMPQMPQMGPAEMPLGGPTAAKVPNTGPMPGNPRYMVNGGLPALQNAPQNAQDRWRAFFASQGRSLPQVGQQRNPVAGATPAPQGGGYMSPYARHANSPGFVGALFRAAGGQPGQPQAGQGPQPGQVREWLAAQSQAPSQRRGFFSRRSY